MKKILLCIIILYTMIYPARSFAWDTQTGAASLITDVEGWAVATLNAWAMPDGIKIRVWIMLSLVPNKTYNDCKDIQKEGLHFAYGGNTFEGDDTLFSVTGLKFNPLINETYSYCAWAEKGDGSVVHKTGDVLTFKPSTAPPYVNPAWNTNPPSGYIKCATEGGTCSYSGIANAAYGGNGIFKYKTNLTSFICDTATFGDPQLPAGAPKACFIKPKGLTNYILCSKQNDQCVLPSKSKVAYGVNNKFFIKDNLTGTVSCNDATFGDPFVGASKYCFYLPIGPENYSYCSNENEVCDFNGTADVAYGANDLFNYKTGVSDFIGCDPVSFGGDPIPNVKKACFKKNSNNFNSITSSSVSLTYTGNGTEVHTASNATNITDESVQISGSAIPRQDDTSPTPVFGYFRYSPVSPETITPVFCNEVFGDDMKSTNEVRIDTKENGSLYPVGFRVNFNSYLTDLIPNTTYYYCAVKSNKDTIEYGDVAHFTTANSPDVTLNSIETKPATVVTATSANLNGFYNTSVNAKTWFEYRKKRTYQDILNTAISQATHASIGNLFFPINSNLINQQSLKVPNNLTQSTTNQLNQLTNAPLSITTNLNNLNQSSNHTTNQYQWSEKINYQTHTAGGSGIMSSPIKNLIKNTTYEFRAVIQTNITGNNPQTTYGDILSFRTSSSSSVTDGDVEHENTQTKTTNLSLGDTATPPDDAVVHYHEGIEHVLVRQLMRDYNRELIEKLGYQDSMNLETFAWDIADFLARTFGYVSSSGKEIRVGPPDKAAYRLVMVDGKLTIYEYFDSKIVAIQDITSSLRKSFEYEYYYTKKVSQ